jgi:hypothetical protein
MHKVSLHFLATSINLHLPKNESLQEKSGGNINLHNYSGKLVEFTKAKHACM